MQVLELHLLPSGALIDVDCPSENELRDLHRLGFHPTILTSQRQTLIKQLSPGHALRGDRESEAEFQAACRAILASGRAIRSVRVH